MNLFINARSNSSIEIYLLLSTFRPSYMTKTNLFVKSSYNPDFLKNQVMFDTCLFNVFRISLRYFLGMLTQLRNVNIK